MSVHSSVWSLGNWLTQSIKNGVVTGRLPIITSLLFIHGPALLKMADELTRGCGRVGVAGVSLSRSSSQYWVGQYCKSQYEDLCGCGEWIEVSVIERKEERAIIYYIYSCSINYQLCVACFLTNGERNAIKSLPLTSHLLQSGNDREVLTENTVLHVTIILLVRGDDSVPSLYVTICKEQLLDPLLEACQCMVDTVTQQYVIQVSLSILLYELRELLIKDGKYKLR